MIKIEANPEEIYLEPVPLLERDGVAKVALARGAVSGHDQPRPVHDHT